MVFDSGFKGLNLNFLEIFEKYWIIKYQNSRFSEFCDRT